MTSPTELGQLKFALSISLQEGTPHFHSVKRNIFRVWRSFVGFCFLKSCHEFIGSGFWRLRLPPIGFHKVPFWVEQAGASVDPKYLFLWLFSFSHHFPSHVLEALSTFRVLNLLHVYSHSLGRHLALNFLVCWQQCQGHAGWHCRLFPVLPW